MIEIRPLTGDELAERLPALAVLRIVVFADYPYLYHGDADYEHRYLAEFAAAPDAVLVAAFDGPDIVGAATASPMWAQKPKFRSPFEKHGIETNTLFYFGESVLLPRYRGYGLGHAFFDHREEAARNAGATAATFASVIRPEDHPARPDGYRPLDEFWRKRCYTPVEGFVAKLAWKEHGEEGESPKPMQYWMRSL